MRRFLYFNATRSLKMFCVLTLAALSLFGCSGALEEAGKALESGDYGKAIEGYKSCVDSEGDTGSYASYCSFMLGMSYFSSKQYPEAITYFKRAIDVYKKEMYVFGLDYAWHYWLGRAYFENRQYREAIANLEKAVSILPKDPEKMFPPGYSSYIPPKSIAYAWLGKAYDLTNQGEEAIDALKKAFEFGLTEKDVSFKAYTTWAYNHMANAYRKLKRYDEAMAAAKRSIEIKPNAGAYQALGLIYRDKGQYSEAISAFKKAIELDPKELSNYFYLSDVFEERDDYTNALTLLKKAEEQLPKDVSVPLRIGQVYMRMGKFDEAIAEFNKAISLITVTGVGLRFMIEDKFPVVKELMEGPAKRAEMQVGDIIVKINGKSTKGWTLEKVAENLRGPAGTQVVLTIKRKGVDQTIEKTITRETVYTHDPAPILALRSLAYRAKGSIGEAEKDAQEAYRFNPNHGDVKEALGAVYIDKGKYAEAIDLLSKTGEDNYFARILEATAYAKLGNAKKAVEIFNSIPDEYLVSKSVLRQTVKNTFLESVKPYVSSQRELAKSLEAKGLYRDALNTYAEILGVADENQKKEIRSAIVELFKKQPAIAQLPEDARRHVMRAEVLTKEGEFEKAVSEYKKAIKIAPYFPTLYKAIALNYAEIKQYRQAIENFKIYLELYPDAPDARAVKDQIYKWEFMIEKEGR